MNYLGVFFCTVYVPPIPALFTIVSVQLGAMGVDAGTSGTIYFDDYDSHRYSEIGLLADPGTEDPTPTPVAGRGFAVFAPCT